MPPKHRFKVDKLIRDKVPELLIFKGVIFKKHVMDQNEYVLELKRKILEEAKEVLDSKTAEELKEELADILEVIQSLCQDFSFEDVVKTQEKKRLEKGGFDKKYDCTWIELSDEHPKLDVYKR